MKERGRWWAAWLYSLEDYTSIGSMRQRTWTRGAKCIHGLKQLDHAAQIEWLAELNTQWTWMWPGLYRWYHMYRTECRMISCFSAPCLCCTASREGGNWGFNGGSVTTKVLSSEFLHSIIWNHRMSVALKHECFLAVSALYHLTSFKIRDEVNEAMIEGWQLWWESFAHTLIFLPPCGTCIAFAQYAFLLPFFQPPAISRHILTIHIKSSLPFDCVWRNTPLGLGTIMTLDLSLTNWLPACLVKRYFFSGGDFSWWINVFMYQCWSLFFRFLHIDTHERESNGRSTITAFRVESLWCFAFIPHAHVQVLYCTAVSSMVISAESKHLLPK